MGLFFAFNEKLNFFNNWRIINNEMCYDSKNGKPLLPVIYWYYILYFRLL